MSFSIGIIGLPNVGKSTLFKALTKKQVPTENFPFCTIDPNVGVVSVPDERLEKLAKISKSEQILPTTIEFVDIAGLVKGAHKGEGLGNQFLSRIREVDAIAHVVRDFENDDVAHVQNRIDPKDDEQIVLLELIMADLDTVENQIKEIKGKTKTGDKDAQHKLIAFEKIKSQLDSNHPARDAHLTDDEQLFINDLHLLTNKPMLNIINVSEDQITRQPKHEHEIIISAKIESELTELDSSDAYAMLSDLGLKKSGLDKLIIASYNLLNLITFFTINPNQTHAWTIQDKTKAPQAAGKVHTDFEKGFIRAEVISCQDFIDSSGEQGAKEKGKMHLEGKEYIVKDGDVCYFRFST